jgi:hypothetical protein
MEPPPDPPAYPPAPTPPPIDLVQELRSGRRARAFLWVGLAAAVLNTATALVAMDWTAREMPAILDAADRGQVYEPVVDGTVMTASTVAQFSALAMLAAGVVFLIWFHRAMMSARALGLRQRLSPTWGVLGFVSPVVDFWFPYWAASDLFPPGHPGRRLVGRWWMAWIGARLTTVAAAVLAFFSPVAAGAGVAATALCYVVAAVLGRAVIAAALSEHHALAERAGRVPAGFDPVTARAAAGAAAGGGPTGGAAVADPWARAAEAAERESGR